MKQVNDNSTVDFAYIPAISFTHAINSEYSRIPLLPDNHLFKHHDTSPEPHIGKAEISTATYTDVVSSLSEMDVSKASDSMGMDQALTKDSVVKRVWNDLLDDILGSKQSTSTAST